MSAFAVATAGVAEACRAPTQITLRLESDFDCAAPGASAGTTTITVGRDFASMSAPGTTLATCASGSSPHDLGTLVLVPSGDDGAVAIAIVAGLGRDACEPGAQDLTGCVVAKRRIRFAKHERLVLPIALRGACSGKSCAGDLTCVHGVCVDSFVDPDTCPDGECADEPDAGLVRDAASGGDASDGDTPVTEAGGGGGGGDATPDVVLVDAAPFDGSNCTAVGLPPSPGLIDCATIADPKNKCQAGQKCCVGQGCVQAASLCGVVADSTCDETADCPKGSVCCTTGPSSGACVGAGGCPLNSWVICKSTCDCNDCTFDKANCGVATCSGQCHF